MQELKNKDAAVVVFSGGQDSTTCLFWALKRYKKVIALSFDYHQKHVKELECAKKICRDHEVEHHIMDMSLLNQLAPNSLTRVDIKVDERQAAKFVHKKLQPEISSKIEVLSGCIVILQYCYFFPWLYLQQLSLSLWLQSQQLCSLFQ